MEVSSAKTKRNDRLSKIRQSLQSLPVVHEKTARLELKLEKSKSRKLSQGKMMNRDECLSKQIDLTDISDWDEQGRSLFEDKYELGEKIGEGAHGVVHKCYHKQGRELYAVKTIYLELEHLLFLKSNFINIRHLKHEHIIGYRAIFFEMKQEKVHLVMEYLPHPDLNHITIESQQQLKEIAYQLFETLDFMHRSSICHRDIKPQNILYDKQRRSVILIDFGISKKVTDRNRRRDMMTVTGTPYYRAPEMFEGGGYDERVDMWAVGVTLFKMMTGHTPFEAEYQLDTVKNIMEGVVNFPQETILKYSTPARTLVCSLLKKKEKRLTASEALKDIWFMGFRPLEDDFTKSLTFQQNNANSIEKVIMANNSMNKEERTDPKMTQKKSGKKQEYTSCKKSLKEIWRQEQQSVIFGLNKSPTTPSTSN